MSGALQLLFKHFSQRAEVLQAFKQVRLGQAQHMWAGAGTGAGAGTWGSVPACPECTDSELSEVEWPSTSEGVCDSQPDANCRRGYLP